MNPIEKQILEHEKASYDFAPLRTILGALIASSFSMIVFLLALIENRNKLLDIAIFFFFLSLILLMDLLINSVKIQIKIQGAKTHKELYRKRKEILGYTYFGIHLFEYGLIFLMLFFELFIISLVFFVFVFYKSICELIESIKTIKIVNKNKIEGSSYFKSSHSKLIFDIIIFSLNFVFLSLILIWVLLYYFIFS